MDYPEYIRVSTAAKLKGVSRGSIYHAVMQRYIDSGIIERTIYVVRNDKFEQWLPKKREK